MPMRTPLRVVALVLTAAVSAAAQEKHPITFEDFSALRGLSDPQLSPDGAWILYALRSTDVEANRRATVTMRASVGSGGPKAFPDDSSHATEARWSPDGKRVAYIAGDQLWVADADGGNRKQLTSLTGGATGPVWSPSGDRIAFTSSVYPDCSDEACNAARAKATRESKVKAHIADELMVRHWNAWDDGTRSHLFVVGVDGGGLRDLTPGATYDTPPGPFGGSEGYAWSPDGKEITYTAKDQGRENAWSTDLNLYEQPLAPGAKPTIITVANKGADANPIYSPDGKYVLYQSQARAGFESDRQRLMAYDRARHESHELLSSWDRNADAYLFTPDGKSILVTTTDASREKFYRVSFANGEAGKPAPIMSEHNNGSLVIARNGRTVAWVRDAADVPAQIFVAQLGQGGLSGVRVLSHENDALLARLKLYPVEDFWFKGADGDSVQGMILRPPQWEPGKKYPAVLLIHGGPQGAWLDQWHSRWNYQLFAAPGFGLVIINPRGSTGYGQKFVDQISKDWGGRVYTDLMNGLDAALQRYSWLDGSRVAAAGGSYGGYMVDWIAGHTDRFKALVTHAGPFNLENMYTATEELWFPEWEYGGPFWDSTAMREQYRRWSPHLYARNFKTPTLVTGGELDFRVPYTEDLSMFTALQRQGVPSRLVIFPDEGHWVLKPQNQRLWWHEVQGWLTRYLTGSSAAALP